MTKNKKPSANHKICVLCSGLGRIFAILAKLNTPMPMIPNTSTSKTQSTVEKSVFIGFVLNIFTAIPYQFSASTISRKYRSMTSMATGAAFADPEPPCSRNTVTAICGFSIGANAANQA